MVVYKIVIERHNMAIISATVFELVGLLYFAPRAYQNLREKVKGGRDLYLNRSDDQTFVKMSGRICESGRVEIKNG
jgi:hypothetical protein